MGPCTANIRLPKNVAVLPQFQNFCNVKTEFSVKIRKKTVRMSSKMLQ